MSADNFDFASGIKTAFSNAGQFTPTLTIGYLSELMQMRLFQEALRTGENTDCAQFTIALDKSRVGELVAFLEPKQIMATGAAHTTLIYDSGYASISAYPESLEISVYGTQSFIRVIREKMQAKYCSGTKFVDWVYNRDDSSVSLPIKIKPLINSAYPKINSKYGSVKNFIDEYKKSDASILIFIGPPGTGKTSLIKHIISTSSMTTPAMVTYDPELMMSDQFFAKFMAGQQGFLVIEDADAILAAREDGNNLMQRFLNLGDGLITTARKKIIFSTNLPHIGEIDPALLRPGRCFAVVDFPELERHQAEAVIAEIGDGRKLPTCRTADGRFTFAEAVSGDVNPDHVFKNQFGFI